MKKSRQGAGMFSESDFADSMADKNQPTVAFAALEKLAAAAIGARLFTLMTFDRASKLASRVYTNMPEQYPVNGTKPIKENTWTRRVLEQGEIFIANDSKGLAEVFDDHELIGSLGLGAVLNVPVVVAGEVIGSINCLEKAGHYTEDRAANAACLRTPGAACFMIERMCRQ